MPTTPSTPRRSTNNRRSAPATPTSTTSKVQGFHDPNSVQDRIRQWQFQGAATDPASDAVSVLSIPTSDIDRPSSQPSRSRPTTRAEKPTETPEVWKSGRLADKDSKEWVRENRSSSTPRKRVISDDRWKAKDSLGEKNSANATPKREFRSRGLGSEHERNASLSREEREERRRRRREAKTSRTTGEDRLKEIYGSVPDSKRKSDDRDYFENRDDPVTQGNVDDELARAFQRPSSSNLQMQSPKEQEEIRPDEDDGRNRRRSKYAETLASGQQVSDPALTVRSRKGSLFNKTKDMFSNREHVPTISHRIPSIEAWLEEQPDPFVDEEAAPVEVPAPLKPRTRRRVSAESKPEPKAADDPNKIWNNVDSTKPTSSGRRRRRRESNKASEDETFTGCVPVQYVLPESPKLSPGGLKRGSPRLTRLREKSFGTKQKTPEPRSPAPAPPAKTPKPPVETQDSYSYHRQPASRPEKQEKSCPRTGPNRLTPIASVETFNSNSGVADPSDFLAQEGPGLKRKLTTHEDLMSQLSLPRVGRSSRRAKSMRGIRGGKTTMTSQDILDELKVDEEKYIRELHTLVNGVIPVLLQCVLSKSESAAAAGLFASSASSKDDLTFTRPIVDMGVALERLKSLHTRIPTHDLDSLLSWAQSAQRAYTDYLKAWRLGFQDVVVNLALKDADTSEIEKGMARDQNGDVVNSEGNKVDVAYLLKRPLVRVKRFGKLFGHVELVVKTSRAQTVAADYEDLTALAARRSLEERGRLEDESAANVDATKARDLKTMAVTTGVSVDKKRRVKARDCFNMTLFHTTGQRIDGRIELILRENQPGFDPGGDLLVCEVEESAKWLLFPPVDTKTISSRKGDKPEDIVVMIRGLGRHEWHELLALKAEDEEAANEWMQMLGSNPLPPKLNRSASFIEQERLANLLQQPVVPPTPLSATALNQANIQAVDVPIGEPSLLGYKEDSRGRSSQERAFVDKPLPKLNLGGGLSKSPQRYRPPASPTQIHRKPVGSASAISSDCSTASGYSRTSYSDSSQTQRYASQEAGSGLHRAGAENGTNSPRSSVVPASQGQTDRKPESTPRKLSRTDNMSREWMSSPDVRSSKPSDDQRCTSDVRHRQDPSPQRPGYQRTLSSTPLKDLPTISKLRTASDHAASAPTTPLTSSIAEQWTSLSGNGKSHSDLPSRSRKKRRPSTSRSVFNTEDLPTPPPHRERSGGLPAAAITIRAEQTLSPPLHRKNRALQPRSDNLPVLKTPNKSSTQSGKVRQRRSSSPLKHEYAPSLGSQSDSDSDLGSSSDTSEDLASEDGDAPTPLVSLTGTRRPPKPMNMPPTAFRQLSSTRASTLTPSDSASQCPYRTVPASSSVPTAQKRKAIATVCSWSDVDMWVPVHPEECSLVISPGLVEIFELTAGHTNSAQSTPDVSRNSSMTDQPLVAFELTVLVNLHSGTGLDISFRSPPTPNSRVKCNKTILFRSRNMAEKQKLYDLLTYARINNPTYDALEKARRQKRLNTVTFAPNNINEPARHSRARSYNFFNLGSSGKRSSYRASSAPSPSVGGETTESTNSLSSAFSALKRLSANSAFAVNRSSVLRKAPGSRYSSSISGSSTPAPSQSGIIPHDGPNVPNTSAAAVDGGGMVNNMKVRLHIRQKDQSKWVNLGAARLTIMPAPPIRKVSGMDSPDGTNKLPAEDRSRRISMTGPSASSPRLPSSSYTPNRVHGAAHEKRIVLTSAKPDRETNQTTTFLDAVLGESCFERIQRVGIAINVWKEEERIQREGGVLLGRNTVWCVSFGGERECGWVFGLVGRYRYGNGNGLEGIGE